MTQLELLIQEAVEGSSEQTKTSKNLSKIKSFLNSSGELAGSVNKLGDSLNENLKGSVGGFTGKVGGWVAGKTTKVVGGLGAGVVTGTLKTLATVIPDKSSLKDSETDLKLSQIVDTYSLPTDKNQLFEHLQYLYNNVNAAQPIFGDKTLDAMKRLHVKAYNDLCTQADKKEDIYKMAKNYAPKKKFGLFG